MKKYLSIAAISILISIAGFLLPGSIFADTIQPDWGYSGAANPSAWGKLIPEFNTCAVGMEQSPIDLKGAVTGSSAPIVFNYKSSPLIVVNNGHTIRVDYAPGSSISIDGEQYALLQFHFHTPSEHQIDGAATAMEVHLVHRNQANELAVVGVMMNTGTEDPLISQIWRWIPASGQTNIVKTTTINAANLLPANKSYYSYVGSLTTPPCSESVKWYVLESPISAAVSQLDRFKMFYPVDARPIQPINDREITFRRSGNSD
jgi:carbonic anhydrase